jgi:quercetin dioxygenase-like cupin family protein
MQHTSVALTIALSFTAGTCLAVASCRADPLSPTRQTADEFKWDVSPRGNARANILGDDGKAGVYVNRTKFPPNTKIQPHSHPDERVVTVISGTLFMGYGERLDEGAAKRLSTGSFWTEPANQPHFVFTKDEEAVIQVVGFGPSGTVRIEPK